MLSLRNKELRNILILSITSVLIFTLLGLWISVEVALLLVLQGILLIFLFFLFTLYRYRNIKKLSTYLRRIRQGEHSLDIRDNVEGELSILKNEIYKVTSMLSEYNEKLKKDKILLADHMADISHQLKTPLTSMLVTVDLLKDRNLPKDKYDQFVSNIYSQLERIKWLVTSLLTISKLDAGVLEMKPVKTKAYDLIRSAIEPLLIPLEIKDISYHIKGGDNYLCVICTGPGKL